MAVNAWFTSDLHFFHKNVIEYCNRPWSFEEQTEQLIERWNSRVGVMDNAYHLGDFAFASFKQIDKVVEIIKQLHGVIHFIKGNHCDDRMWRAIRDRNIAHVAWIKDYAEVRVDGQKVILCHYPFEMWNGAHHGSWHLHGHCHGSLPAVGKRLDVGIDNHPESQVFSWDEISEHMAKQTFAVKDHHTGER